MYHDCDDARAALENFAKHTGLTLELEPETRPLTYSKDPIRFRWRLGAVGVSDKLTLSGSYSAGIGLAERWAKDWADSDESNRPKGLTIRFPRKDISRACAPRWGSQRLSIYEAELLAVIHAAYRPELVDVISVVLMDAASVDGMSDWIEWAEDLGMLSEPGQDAAGLRKARQAFHTCQDHARGLRILLGGQYDAAIEAAQSM